MSWHFSLALVEAFSAGICWGGDVSAPSNTTQGESPSLCSGRMTASWRRFQSGPTCGHSMADLGADVLTWFLEGFHVKPIPRRLRETTLRTISGRKCGGSWQMSLPGTSLPRTSSEGQSIARPTTSRRWVMKPEPLPLARQTWVRTTFGHDIGYLHTPTATANYAAPSMQKHPCAREFVRVFGKPSPLAHEWLMGWPIGWTDSRPLEMDRFRSWQQQHGCS